ncbi:MAG: tetratricopeptide repeat protein [Vicinamibacterales bacterium]|nr:tetratricopeptide repeat protein [Vicinamibacterales bacterium]
MNAVLPFELAEGHPLAQQIVVFTGKLWSLGRREARALVAELGGTAEDEITARTSMLVVGAGTYPQGVPDDDALAADTSTHSQKLRRAAQINRETPGRIRVISEDAYCRLVGLPPVAALREQHYAQRDILTMYPALREDHLRYLQKWGFIHATHRNTADTWFGFADLAVLRQVHAELQRGAPFRAVLRDLQASRSGQLAFDFRLEAPQARILTLAPRDAAAPVAPPARPAGLLPPSPPLTDAEQYFLMGSLLDDGTAERQEEAARAYRRALDADPDLPAALINLANIRYARDELAEAQALYERAITLDATFFEAYFNLGNIHHDHGRYRDAEDCYRRALALNPEYPDAHFYMAVTLEKTGRSADARPYWHAYQRLAPEGEWVELAREFSD